MSDKLLHERLREHATKDIIGDFECGNKMIASLRDYEALALADEIERQYVPVPRFPDGEPVREGSETRYGTVSFTNVEVSDRGRGNWIMHMDDGNRVVGTFSQRVERPEPDSLEKAMERFQSILEDHDGLAPETEYKLWEVHGRLTALMERGA